MAKKLKGKEWYNILAPKLFNEKSIGGTPAGEPKSLIGRVIEVHLINLIDDLSKYYMKLFFKIVDIKENNAYTEFSGLECLRDYVSRSIRYGVKRIDTIQDLTTEEKKKIRIKTIIITSKKIKKNVVTTLKKFIEDKLKKEIESCSLDKLLEEIINDDIKRSIIEEGGKIYPIRTFEVRKIEMLNK